MFIAMNRFKISNGNEKDFEKIWKSRESYLDEVDGFLGFNLVKGVSNDKYTLYASHSTWRSEDHFKEWTKSEEFRKAHKNAGNNKNLYLDHPKFEGFTVVL
tara:strand:+ start:224 stop:526 length:303 start_codon:yes stop_codon:yes gene_type:complete